MPEKVVQGLIRRYFVLTFPFDDQPISSYLLLGTTQLLLLRLKLSTWLPIVSSIRPLSHSLLLEFIESFNIGLSELGLTLNCIAHAYQIQLLLSLNHANRPVMRKRKPWKPPRKPSVFDWKESTFPPSHRQRCFPSSNQRPFSQSRSTLPSYLTLTRWKLRGSWQWWNGTCLSYVIDVVVVVF